MNQKETQKSQIEENQLIKEYEYLNKKKEQLKTVINSKTQLDKIEERMTEIDGQLLISRKNLFSEETNKEIIEEETRIKATNE